jgi:hypothetical protein
MKSTIREVIVYLIVGAGLIAMLFACGHKGDHYKFYTVVDWKIENDMDTFYHVGYFCAIDSAEIEGTKANAEYLIYSQEWEAISSDTTLDSTNRDFMLHYFNDSVTVTTYFIQQ